MPADNFQLSDADRAEMRQQVDQMFSRSKGYRQLPGDEQRRLAADVEALVTIVARDRSDAIDVPAFVADLIAGTLHAVLLASTQQMRAYADLVAHGLASIEQFSAQAHSRPAMRQRQQLLASMVLMGMNRVELTDTIRARSVFEGDRADM
jgi:hypothetical protein